jgi:ribokinase
MFDLISIGDTVIDIHVPIQDALVYEKEGTSFLAMRYGDKVPVGMASSMVGGNAANNAVGSSRLGLRTAVYTNIGNDHPDDSRIMNQLKKEGVDTRYVVHNRELPSNHNIILDYKGERTILVHHQPWHFNLPNLDRTKWIYLTSMSPSYVESNVIEQILSYVSQTGAKLFYNPGTFQIKAGLKRNKKLYEVADVLIMNREEAKLVLGFHEGESVPIRKLLEAIHELGVKNAVVTDGGDGSYGTDGHTFYHLAAFPARLVERTGAGDAFATGLLAGFFHGEELDGALRWGAANGAAVIEYIGPQAGLLSKEQMEQRLKINSDIVAKKF